MCSGKTLKARHKRAWQALFKRVFSLVLNKPRPSRSDIGRTGEKKAARFLIQTGHRILAQNWGSPAGEIDIVANKGATLIIAEVKTRMAALAQSFDPLEAVDNEKELRIKSAADYYLWQYGATLKRARIRHVRFDILAVTIHRRFGLTRWKIRHEKGAFA